MKKKYMQATKNIEESRVVRDYDRRGGVVNEFLANGTISKVKLDRLLRSC